MSAEVSVSGPLFDGRAAAAFHAYSERLQDKLGDELADRVRRHLASVIRVNRGVYESHIQSAHSGDHVEVSDGWIIYGPWLEGVGSRNSPVTRFPGYHTFRVVCDQFQPVAPDIAQRELPPYVAEAN